MGVEEHLEPIGCFTGLQGCQWSSTCHDRRGKQGAHRSGKTRHSACEGDKQEATSRKCRIHNVLADPAKEHLDHQNGKNRAQRGHPQRDGSREIDGKDHARNGGRQILDRQGKVHEPFINKLGEHGRGHRDKQNQKHTQAIGVHAHATSGQERNKHVTHQASGCPTRPDMRGNGDVGG